jgi:hypothetical protein
MKSIVARTSQARQTFCSKTAQAKSFLLESQTPRHFRSATDFLLENCTSDITTDQSSIEVMSLEFLLETVFAEPDGK